METKAILKALKAISYPIPLDEVQTIMDRELEKDMDEMDDELIDLCMDILERGYAEQEPKQEQPERKQKRIKVSRVLAAAAIIALIIAVAVPVAATFCYNEVSDKIVHFYSDYFHINLRKRDTTANHYSDENTDLIQELQKRGFNNVILPSNLLNYSYSENIIIQENDNAISATINIEDSESGINGIIFITQWDESFSTFAGNENVTADFRHVEQITVNGLDIIVVGNDDDKVSIRYLDRNTDYSITLIECDFETAVEIANSLK